MTILNRNKKGSFDVHSLHQSGLNYITTEFGAKVEPEFEGYDVNGLEVKTNDVTDGEEKDALVSISSTLIQPVFLTEITICFCIFFFFAKKLLGKCWSQFRQHFPSSFLSSHSLAKIYIFQMFV